MTFHVEKNGLMKQSRLIPLNTLITKGLDGIINLDKTWNMGCFYDLNN